MWPERIKEVVGIMMIGEGAVGLLEPRRHVLLWRRGPGPWEHLMDVFVERPRMTRILAAMEVLFGLSLALRQASRVIPRVSMARSMNGKRRSMAQVS